MNDEAKQNYERRMSALVARLAEKRAETAIIIAKAQALHEKKAGRVFRENELEGTAFECFLEPKQLKPEREKRHKIQPLPKPVINREPVDYSFDMKIVRQHRCKDWNIKALRRRNVYLETCSACKHEFNAWV